MFQGISHQNMALNDSWLVVSTYPSEKYELVSWDDDIPNMMGKS